VYVFCWHTSNALLFLPQLPPLQLPSPVT